MPNVNTNNNASNFASTLKGLEQNAAESIKLTQAAGKLNNQVTEAETLEKMAKKGFDAAKGLIG